MNQQAMIEALVDDGYTLEEAAAELARSRAFPGTGGNGRRPPRRPRLAEHEQVRRVAREMALLQGLRWSEMTREGRAAVEYLAALAIRAIASVDEATRRRARQKRDFFDL